MEASNHHKLLCQTLLWFITWINISSVQVAFSLVTCWKIEGLPVRIIESHSMPVALDPWIWDVPTLLTVTHYGCVLCFYLKLQRGYWGHIRFHFPPLDHNVDFKLLTHVVSSFRLYVKLRSKFAKFISEVNLVQNLNLLILTKQTVNCFSLGLMKAPFSIYVLM